MGAKIKMLSECGTSSADPTAGLCNLEEKVDGVELNALQGIDKLGDFNLTKEEVVGNVVNR